jgi:heat shock protein 4
MSVVGIDFGSESSKVAVARRKAIDVLQNEVGNRKTASYVGFSDRQRLIGDEAAAQCMSNSANTFFCMKRFLGVSFDDPWVARESAYVPYKPVNLNGKVGFEAKYCGKREVFSVEQITAALLQKLKGVAEKGLENQRVTDCVLSVPSWWPEAPRRALLDAANIAGLNVLRLMNETTAVALNYGILRPLPKDEASKVMFVDIGATSTTATVASFVAGGLKILGTASDPFLGGRDFDGLLVQHFDAYIKKQYKMDVLSNDRSRLKLWKECERVKRILSANSKVIFNVEYIMNDTDVKGEIDKPFFEELCQKSLLPRIMGVLQKAMDTAGLKPADLTSIEVIGGATRIPVVTTAISNFLGKPVSYTCDSDESIARGATLQCAMLSPSFRVREFEVHDVQPYPILIQWGPENGEPEQSSTLFEVNNPVPFTKMISFTDRSQPFQLVARYAEPQSIPVLSTPILGRFVISGMVPPQAGKRSAKVKVRFQLTLHGTVAITSAQAVTPLEDPSPSTTPAPAAEPAKVEAGKMDTADDKAKDAKKPAEEKKEDPKKKVKREDLKIASFGMASMDQKGLTAAVEREALISAQDHAIAETNAERNALESYCLEMRGKVEDELSEFVAPAIKDKFLQDCTDTEEWLYDAGADAQKSEVKAKLAALRAVGDAAKKREFEFLQRDDTLLTLKNAINRWSKLAASEDEKYSHIEASERKKVTDACTAADQLLSTDLQKQSKLGKAEDPVITVANLHSRADALNKTCAAVMNKAKPAPPKPEVKPEEKKPEAGGPAPDASADGTKQSDAPKQPEGDASKGGDATKPQVEADMDMD